MNHYQCAERNIRSEGSFDRFVLCAWNELACRRLAAPVKVSELASRWQRRAETYARLGWVRRFRDLGASADRLHRERSNAQGTLF